MIVSLYGIEKKLITNNTSISVLNINNSILYRSIIRFLRLDLLDETKNEVVFFENQERINGKEIVYIQDLYSYKFDSKLISEKVIKSYIQEVNYDINDKIELTLLYRKLIEKLIMQFDILEVDYEYKEELDFSFFSKIPGFNFSANDEKDPIDKIIDILNINIKVLKKKYFVFNQTMSLMTKEELIKLNDFVVSNNCNLLFIDNMDENEIIFINNLCVDRDYGAYSLAKDDMI